MIELMHLSKEYQLNDLARRSSEALKPMITRDNCVKFYQLAEEIESKLGYSLEKKPIFVNIY